MEPLFWSQLQYTSVKLRDCILHSCDVFTATGSVHRYKVHMFGNVKATSMLSSGPHFARIIHQLFFHSFFCRCIQPVFIVVLCYAKIVVIKYIYASGLHLHSCFGGKKTVLHLPCTCHSRAAQSFSCFGCDSCLKAMCQLSTSSSLPILRH